MTTSAAPSSVDVPGREAPEEHSATDRRASHGRPRTAKAFLIVGALLAIVLVGALAWWLSTRGKESTDDAQIQADVVPLAPRVGGPVRAVLVQENSHVKAGDVILVIDDADYAVGVRQAEADRATAEAALVRAQPEASIDERELARSERLHADEALPEQQLERAQVTARTGRAGVLQARASLAASEAALETAKLKLTYTKVTAPADGTVSSIAAHPGQILAAEQPFAQFVPERAYVVANFKETQIGAMRPGERAAVTVDAYGGRALEGRVESLSFGTGAEFSLLPASNATGNFVKVVQRVPVRIALVDPPADLAMRAGLSAYVTVYVK